MLHADCTRFGFGPYGICSASKMLWGADDRGAPCRPREVNAQTEDDELLLSVSEGDPQAYRELVNRHLRSVHAFTYRLLGNRAEAEEVTQETFLRVWQRANSYSPHAKVKSWLFRIAHNLAVDVLRRRRDHRGGEATESQPASGQPSQRLEQKRRAEAVRTALLELPERQRAAVILAHYEGLSNREVAHILKVRVRAAESLLARGRRQLKSLLAEVYLDEGELS